MVAADMELGPVVTAITKTYRLILLTSRRASDGGLSSNGMREVKANKNAVGRRAMRIFQGDQCGRPRPWRLGA
jgi:hypothetical protein